MSQLRDLSHRLVPMSGRDVNAEHRPATMLELLFDLTFVIAFGTALTPWVTVVGYERWGHQHHAKLLAELDQH